MRDRLVTYSASASRANETTFQALADPTRRAMLDLLRRGSQPAGQIAGAWLGFERLPSDVVARLPQREFILSTAQRFTSMISVVKTPF